MICPFYRGTIPALLLGFFLLVPASHPRLLGQEEAVSPFFLGGIVPGGVRNSATESWGSYDFILANRSDQDREARIMMFFEGQPDVQYGRDVWIPARSTLNSWMLVGPAPFQDQGTSLRSVQVLLYDRTGGKEQLLLPSENERIRSRAILYRKKEPHTAIILDGEETGDWEFGRPPQPEVPSEEAVQLCRVLRGLRKYSPLVQRVNPGALPPSPEAYDGVDHLVVASNRLALDPAGLQAIRSWVHRGGRVWVMLDLVDPQTIGPLLGDALDFQVVDRTSLTQFQIESTFQSSIPVPALLQEYERPVDWVRVLLPGGEKVRHTVHGWPLWFTRKVGRGSVIFTTLGARGWVRPRERGDPASPYEDYMDLPVPVGPLDLLVGEVDPPAETGPLSPALVHPLLEDEVGVSVLNQRTIAGLFALFFAGAVGLGIALRRTPRWELLGFVGPFFALLLAGTFVIIGLQMRRGVPATMGTFQFVEAVKEDTEFPIQGHLAVYRPESGPAEMGALAGGMFDLDMAGLEGKSRRLVTTDLKSWKWDNLSLPAGIRYAPFRTTFSLSSPIRAMASFGPDGLEGKFHSGPFKNLQDAILVAPNGTCFHLIPGETNPIRANQSNQLVPGQFFPGALVTDLQRKRQKIYTDLLQNKKRHGLEGDRPILMTWADPLELNFQLAKEARVRGQALLVIPVEMKKSGVGNSIRVPGSFVKFRRVLNNGLVRPTQEGKQGLEQLLRFQVPDYLLPFQVEKGVLRLRIDAPGRAVEILSKNRDESKSLSKVTSPLDPIQIELADQQLLESEPQAGFLFLLKISEQASSSANDRSWKEDQEKWQILSMELELVGKVVEVNKQPGPGNGNKEK